MTHFIGWARSTRVFGLALGLAVATAPAGVGPASAAPDRLTREVAPVAQRVALRLDPREPGYSGTTTITIEAVRPFSEVRLHAEGLTVEAVNLAGGTVHLAAKWASEDDAHMLVTFPERVPSGLYQLTIRFLNEFDTRATSLYRLQSGGEWYAFTQLEADDAREAFPCFDEPEFKIPWTIELTVPAEHMAVSNTPIVSETPAADGWKVVQFKTSKPMPSYIVAIASGPLEAVPIEGMAIPGRVITVKGQSHLAGEAQRACPPLLTALEAYFGRPYPYEKLDLLALPEFWPGAMENAGAITFADGILLLDDRTASIGQKRRLASITAHELAHMWFGDLVTMRWWDDLWLNESFASWLGEKIAHEVFPEYGIEHRLVTDSDEAMRVDGRISTRTIRQPVKTLDNLLQSADVLAYKKGQTVLGMFEQWLGPETFRAGVRTYLATWAWRNAEANDLWTALSGAAKKDIGGPMATFLDQPGLALVAVEPLPGGRVRLSQSRFLPAGTVAPTPQRWSIPVTLKYGSASGPAKFKNVLLTAATQVVALEPGTSWVYPNGRAYGYYRWRMPDEAIHALVENAAGALDARERMELLYNAGALLDAGAMTGDTYLAVLEKLVDDPEPLVVQAALAGMQAARGAFIEPEMEDAFARYVDRALSPPLARFGVERQAGEAETVSLVRGPLLLGLAREGRNARARALGDSLARAYLADPASIDPGLSSAAIEIAALGGDVTLWETYRERFEAATNPGQRRLFLSALGAFPDPEIRDRAFAYTLSGPLRPQEQFTIARAALVLSEANRDAAYTWVVTNYDAIRARIPPMNAVFIPLIAAGCSAERLARAQEFFAQPAHAPGGTEKELAKLTESVEDCVALRKREGERVRAYLNRTGVAN